MLTDLINRIGEFYFVLLDISVVRIFVISTELNGFEKPLLRCSFQRLENVKILNRNGERIGGKRYCSSHFTVKSIFNLYTINSFYFAFQPIIRHSQLKSATGNS